MKWHYRHLSALVGQRIEVVALKTLCDGTATDAQRSGLAYCRLYFSLGNGESVECAATGFVVPRPCNPIHPAADLVSRYREHSVLLADIVPEPGAAGGVRYTGVANDERTEG